MERGRRAAAPALAALAAAALAGCVAPDNAYLMELNRHGRWKEAERIGLDMLARRDRFSHSQTCETYFNVIYAETRQGKRDEARRLTGEYDRFSALEAIDPRLLWLGREMARLKGELGLLGEAQGVLVSAMEANGRGDYLQARGLCEAVLAMEGANRVQEATAHFVAAVCSIRLKEASAAEGHLKAFDELKAALPPGHQALAEEAYARQGLAELEAAGGAGGGR